MLAGDMAEAFKAFAESKGWNTIPDGSTLVVETSEGKFQILVRSEQEFNEFQRRMNELTGEFFLLQNGVAHRTVARSQFLDALSKAFELMYQFGHMKTKQPVPLVPEMSSYVRTGLRRIIDLVEQR